MDFKLSKLDLEFPLAKLKKNMGGNDQSFFKKASQLHRTLPISVFMMAMSGVLWLVMFIVVYQVITMFSLYNSVVDETDLEGKCDERFSSDPSVNFDHVMRYPHGEAGPYLARFKSERMESAQQTTGDSLPPFVTAVSSQTFFKVQGLIKQFRKDIPELKRTPLIIYDIGLYKKERDLMEKYCDDCDVRTFEMSIYPDHVADISLNAWKPIIIQKVIDQYGSAIYIDPDMRLKSVTSLNILHHRGDRDFFVWDHQKPKSIIAYTYPLTFKFLSESRCAFKDAAMIATDVLVVFGSNSTWQLLMKPWLSCALNKECIAPSGARTSYCFHVRRPKTTGCHMFDQSVLSIILNRAFQITLNRDRYIPQRIAFHADEEILHFEEQPWTNTQLYTIIFILILILCAYQLIRRRRRIPFKIL